MQVHSEFKAKKEITTAPRQRTREERRRRWRASREAFLLSERHRHEWEEDESYYDYYTPIIAVYNRSPLPARPVQYTDPPLTFDEFVRRRRSESAAPSTAADPPATAQPAIRPFAAPTAADPPVVTTQPAARPAALLPPSRRSSPGIYEYALLEDRLRTALRRRARRAAARANSTKRPDLNE